MFKSLVDEHYYGTVFAVAGQVRASCTDSGEHLPSSMPFTASLAWLQDPRDGLQGHREHLGHQPQRAGPPQDVHAPGVSALNPNP